MKKHVFISYARENLPQVKVLAANLQRAGEKVWYDKHPEDGIAGGEDWQLRIKQALKDSYAFIVCCSRELENRPVKAF